MWLVECVGPDGGRVVVEGELMAARSKTYQPDSI